jgi:hypothetical protein
MSAAHLGMPLNQTLENFNASLDARNWPAAMLWITALYNTIGTGLRENR